MIFEARIYEKFLCKEENIDARGNERNGKGGRRKEEAGENGKRRNSMLPKKMSESLNSDTYSRGFGGVAVFSMQKS